MNSSRDEEIEVSESKWEFYMSRFPIQEFPFRLSSRFMARKFVFRSKKMNLQKLHIFQILLKQESFSHAHTLMAKN